MKRRKKSTRRWTAAMVLALCWGTTRTLPCVVAQTFDGERERYALLIGVSQYDNPGWTTLLYPAKDVALVERGLCKHGGFKGENVVALTCDAENGEFYPTKENVERELKKLLARAREKDLIFVMFSGHGAQNATERLFAPVDAVLGDENTMISLSDAIDDLNDASAVFKCVMIDACRTPLPCEANERTASDAEGLKGAKKEAADALLPWSTPPWGRAFKTIVLESCAGGQACYENNELGNSVFTHFFVESFEKGDENGDGKVTLGEAMYYAGGKARDWVYKKHKGKFQTPLVENDESSKRPLSRTTRRT